jgi:hypothetical protein
MSPQGTGMAKTKIKRFYYRSGQLLLEEPYLEGQFHGTVRSWHKNGKLASQEPYRHGLRHGVARQWDDQGRLLGSFRMNKGTGISRRWHPNGQLEMEISNHQGKITGLSRTWLSDGTLIDKTWYLGYREVTRTQYEAALAKNPDLPQCPNDPQRPLRSERAAERKAQQLLAQWLRSRPTSRPALEWLTDPGIKTKRHFGHFRSTKSAIAFVTQLIEAGVRDVIATEIYGFNGEVQICDYVVGSMPKNCEQRRRILQLCEPSARAKGLRSMPGSDLRSTELILH